jgi:hypothetical protein
LNVSWVSARHLTAGALVSIVAGAVYGRIAWGMFVRSDDFNDHLLIAQHLYETGRPTVPHFLFHGVTAAIHAVLSTEPILVAGALATVAAHFLTGAVLYAVYWSAFRGSRLAAPGLAAVLALFTLLAQPITLANAYTLGYIWPEPYHSPTYAMLKPFALACFAGTAWFLARRQWSIRLTVLFGIVTVAGGLSKPSFMICVLPAALLMAAYRLWRRQPLSTRSLIDGLYAPAAAVLVWQFSVAFSGVDDAGGMYQDSVSWAPLKVMQFWATGLPAKFVASALFPLAVTALYWPLARRDTLLQFAWMCFGVGALYSYALIETTNWASGNFIWSGYITLFTLMVAATIFWLRHATSAEGTWTDARSLLCGAVFVLHVASGARLTWLYLTHYGCRVDFRLADYVCN